MFMVIISISISIRVRVGVRPWLVLDLQGFKGSGYDQCLRVFTCHDQRELGSELV